MHTLVFDKNDRYPLAGYIVINVLAVVKKAGGGAYIKRNLNK
jgi:hypothetical protein